MKKFSYSIMVKELIPPMGGGIYKYYAKVSHIYKDIGKKEIEIYQDFGEIHGKTSEEADQKMRELIQKWIDNQNK